MVRLMTPAAVEPHHYPIVVELEIEPQGKQRPRFGKGKVYTPAATKAFEEALAWQGKLAMKGEKPLWGPLRARITAFVGIPKSYKRDERLRAMAGELYPHGDVDNFAKAALDALNGVVYLDDAQVVVLEARKAFSPVPAIRVEITKL